MFLISVDDVNKVILVKLLFDKVVKFLVSKKVIEDLIKFVKEFINFDEIGNIFKNLFNLLSGIKDFVDISIDKIKEFINYFVDDKDL